PGLGSVLRLGRVPDDEVGDAEGDALICVHEFSVGVLVSALRPFDELRLIEWSAHHRRYYTAAGSSVPARQLERRVRSGAHVLEAAVDGERDDDRVRPELLREPPRADDVRAPRD